MSSDILFVSNIYPAREKEIQGVSSELILNNLECDSSSILSMSKIPLKVANVCSENDMIIVMGAGDIRNITDEICNEIKDIK